MKSKGTSSTARQPGSTLWRASTAVSSGLTYPVCRPALVTARASTRELGRPLLSTAALRSMAPWVRVPVLSVHSTFMLPRSSIASRRRTITLARARRRAPDDRLTATMAGSIWGETPMASARENRTASSAGLPNATFTTRMTAVSMPVTRASSRPKRAEPCSNPVRGRLTSSSCDTCPSSVAEPVTTATASPLPLTT